LTTAIRGSINFLGSLAPIFCAAVLSSHAGRITLIELFASWSFFTNSANSVAFCHFPTKFDTSTDFNELAIGRIVRITSIGFSTMDFLNFSSVQKLFVISCAMACIIASFLRKFSAINFAIGFTVSSLAIHLAFSPRSFFTVVVSFHVTIEIPVSAAHCHTV
jgi:hypothetical protein